jgi:hypothetical protein
MRLSCTWVKTRNVHSVPASGSAAWVTAETVTS